MQLPYLPWMPTGYNNNFPFTGPRQAWNALLNFMERRAGRDELRSDPLVIQAEVTKRCNIDCIMCLRENVPDVDMSDEVVDKLVGLSSGIGEMQLYGYGEPLMSRAFYALISRLQCARLTFTTNGTLLTQKVLQKILADARRPVYAINFSIDGATAGTYEAIRRGADFRRVIGNLGDIDAHRKARGLTLPKTEILFLAMKRTIRELPEAVRLAAGSGAAAVHVAHIIVWDESERDESLLYHPEETLKYFTEARSAAAELSVTLNLPAAINLDNAGGMRPEAAPKCYWPWRHPVVKYNGDVQPCCAAPDVSMGNLLEESFTSIWNGPRFRGFRRQVNSAGPPAVCRTCDIRYRGVPRVDGIEDIYVRRPPSNR